MIKRNRVKIVNLLAQQSKYLACKESINILKKLKAVCSAYNESDIEKQLLLVSRQRRCGKPVDEIRFTVDHGMNVNLFQFGAQLWLFANVRD